MPSSQSRRLASILNLHDLERAAKRHLPRPIYGYIANVAEDGHTARANRSAFDAYSFLPRALVDVSTISWKPNYLAGAMRCR